MIRLLFQHTTTLGVRGKYLRPLRSGPFGKKCADFLRSRAGKICRGLGDPAQKSGVRRSGADCRKRGNIAAAGA